MSERQVIGGRFEITDPERDLLGRGGMGDVYRGKDLQTGEPVAIKALRPEVVSGTPDAIARFLREGEALRELNHPNIVHMVDAVEDADAGRHYLVMEYVPGGSLRDLLEQEGRLSVGRTVEVALDVADALTRAHRIRIIHRDLKPSNVLLAEDGTPRLTDFGVAQLASGPRLTGADRAVGTVDYMSPEACNLEALDRPTDIWSFGVMLFEMLAGQRPFAGDSPMATLTAILTQLLPDLQRLCPDAPDALVDLVYRMLEKDRQQRIPSVRMVGTELEAMLEAISTQPSAVSTQRPAVRHPRSIIDHLPTHTTSRFATPTPTTETPRHNLPVQVTPFVGREAELAELERLLSDPSVRLVTILGAGGMGKTRLALRTAESQLDRFANGVYFVPLAPLRSLDAIVPTIANALGFSFYEDGTPRQQLLDYLCAKRMLLVLDNYEHLLASPARGANGDGAADIVAEILKTAPDVHLLTTSRARLDVQGEHLFRLSGLHFPDWETPDDALEPTSLTLRDATQYSAVKLFLQSARRVRPGFELGTGDLRYVSRICRLVGGMPLGILLAAAWIEMLSPGEIATEVQRSLDFLDSGSRDLPNRQRSVRAVYNHSWNLLTEGEQGVFAALSVFRGGFSRDAAQKVTGASLRELRTLVDRSLLHRAPTGRYEVHELLRRYAAEKLGGSPDEGQAVRDRHSAYYLVALREWGADIEGGRQQVAFHEMDVEIQNARAAWDWAVEQGQVEPLDQAAGGLYFFYLIRMREQEGESAFRQAAQKLSAIVSTSSTALADRFSLATSSAGRVLAKVLAAQANFSEPGLCRQLITKSLALLERPELSDQDTRPERAFILRTLGYVCALDGDRPLEEARQWLGQSLALYQVLGDHWGTTSALEGLGMVAWALGDYGNAKRLRQESLEAYRTLGDQEGIARSLRQLGYVAFGQGQLEEGERLSRESLALAREMGDRPTIAKELLHSGVAQIYLGRYAEAQSLLEQSLMLHNELGYRRSIAYASGDLGYVQMHLGQYKQARRLGEESLSSAQGAHFRWRVGMAFLLLGSVALAEAECLPAPEGYDHAQQYLQKSIDVFQEMGQQADLGLTLAVLALAARALGQLPRAEQHLCEALQNASQTQAFRPCLYALVPFSLRLADRGEAERAVELYALASRYLHVANSRWFEDVVGRHIAAAAAHPEGVPPDAVAAAQARGRGRDLWATVEELLAELGES